MPEPFPERYILVGCAYFYIFNNKSHEHSNLIVYEFSWYADIDCMRADHDTAFSIDIYIIRTFSGFPILIGLYYMDCDFIVVINTVLIDTWSKKSFPSDTEDSALISYLICCSSHVTTTIINPSI